MGLMTTGTPQLGWLGHNHLTPKQAAKCAAGVIETMSEQVEGFDPLTTRFDEWQFNTPDGNKMLLDHIRGCPTLTCNHTLRAEITRQLATHH